MKVTVAFATIASALALAACSSSGATDRGGNSSLPPAESATVPPATESAIPDGVYRTRITKDAFVVDTDPATAGTWTLILKDGTYKVTCEWVDEDGDDCGHSDIPSATVEVGSTAGDATTLWLQYDQALTEKDPNVAPEEPTNEQQPPYRVNFTVRGDQVVFDHLWVAPTAGWQPDGPNSWDFQPWTKIS
jgi:major membrane immunogen (membrane-anchored lipoprotein)